MAKVKTENNLGKKTIFPHWIIPQEGILIRSIAPRKNQMEVTSAEICGKLGTDQ